MLNFPALDVALGLVFVYFILALVCSGINEAIASRLRWRSQDLERGLWELLQDPKQGTKALDEIKKHPLIFPMLNPQKKTRPTKDDAAAAAATTGPPKTSRDSEWPSYLPSRTFAIALLGIEQKTISAAKGTDVKAGMRKLNESIEAIPSERVQEALTALLHNAQGDAVLFRRNVEQWYDDHMERVSGWYKRRITRVLWVLAFVVAITLNADTLQTAKRLWVEPSVRASLVSQAQNATTQTPEETNPSNELSSLPVPLGWHLATADDDPQGFPFYGDWDMLWSLLSKLVGLSLTAVAITFGAPFWFDLLSKLGRLRNSGAPPAAADAVRHGEGEETRRGESATLAAAIVAASGKRAEEPDTEPAAGAQATGTPATD